MAGEVVVLMEQCTLNSSTLLLTLFYCDKVVVVSSVTKLPMAFVQKDQEQSVFVILCFSDFLVFDFRIL